MTESVSETTEVMTVMGSGVTVADVAAMTAGVIGQGMTAETVTGGTAAGTETGALTETWRGKGLIGVTGTAAAEAAVGAAVAAGQRVVMHVRCSRKEWVVIAQLLWMLKAVMGMPVGSLTLVLVVAAAGEQRMRCSG